MEEVTIIHNDASDGKTPFCQRGENLHQTAWQEQRTVKLIGEDGIGLCDGEFSGANGRRLGAG